MANDDIDQNHAGRENFIRNRPFSRYCRLLLRFRPSKLKFLSQSPQPPAEGEAQPTQQQQQQQQQHHHPQPQNELASRDRYALRQDVDYEFKKFDLFRRCENKIDELNRIFGKYPLPNRLLVQRATLTKELAKRNLERKLRNVDTQMQSLMADIRAKQLELRRLTVADEGCGRGETGTRRITATSATTQ